MAITTTASSNVIMMIWHSSHSTISAQIDPQDADAFGKSGARTELGWRDSTMELDGMYGPWLAVNGKLVQRGVLTAERSVAQ